MDRFWSKIKKTDTCWLWTGGSSRGGYGVFVLRKPDRAYAHRFSWYLENGDIPDGLLVLHRCDIPSCVRPDHLFLGTQQDNMDDMIAKGRQMDYRARVPRNQNGSKNNMAKLTDDQVFQIRLRREAGEGPVALAREYGVTYGNIWKIVTGRGW